MAALAVGLLSAAGPANAQATRTWVSGVGDDANPCSRTAPCQTFAGAFGKTAAGGEIDCLDPGGFGTLEITHAISIICDGVSNGGINVSGGSALAVSAGASDTVILSGLDINVAGVGSDGIDFTSGQALYIRNCVIRVQAGEGVQVSAVQTTPTSIDIDNTTVEEIAPTSGGIQAGIIVVPQSSGSVSVTINHTKVAGGSFGIVADGIDGASKISGVVRDSVVTHNVQNGVTVSTGSASGITLLIDNVAVTNNRNYGLAASGPNAGMIVSNSTISGNGGGLNEASSGVIDSYGNNRVNANNGNDGAFSNTIAQK
jgi:hypothetical protein